MLPGRTTQLLDTGSCHLPTFFSCMPAGQATGLGPLGIVVGSRAHLEKQAMAKRNRLRNFLTKGFHFLVMLVAGGAVRDTQCGFKVSEGHARGASSWGVAASRCAGQVRPLVRVAGHSTATSVASVHV